METRSGSSFGRSLFLIVLFFSVLIAFGAATLLTVRAQSGGLSSMSVVYKDGMALERYIINSPPRPPASFNSASTLYKAPEPGVFSSSKTLIVPAYDWVYGCSSVSGAMISGYYDLNGYPNLYAGPANGGNAPMNNSASVWPVWPDSSTTYPNLPLAASHKGVDGRGAAVKGSIDDYWVSYGSTDNDPYTTGGWTPHSWNDGFAIGDYMKTSQKLWVDPGNPAIIINTDGSTTFYNYGTGARYQCTQMALDGVPYSYDGSLGRKQFYEARGYTVTDCYNQVTDNKSSSGFTYAQYKAEIDAGRPVMLNLYTAPNGHTVVGVGYEDPNTIIIHDTWIIGGDWVNVNHTMTWGGSYGNPLMELSSVSIVNLAPLTPPAAFNKTSPANASNALPGLTLRWGASAGATAFRYCLDADTDTTCNTGWHDVGLNISVVLTGQALGPHSWQVQATNGSGTTDANSNTWWTFTVVSSQKIFLPFINKQLPPPGAFNKISPANGAGGQSNSPTLSWGASSGVSSYEYCIDKTNDNTCNGSGGVNGTVNWTSVSSNTSVVTAALSLNTVYYWQVRAVNAESTTYANNGTWWTFSVNPMPGYWGGEFENFYINPSSSQVLEFTTFIYVEECDTVYSVTRLIAVPITGNSFSFSGIFYGNGIFDSATTAHGTDGITGLDISDCAGGVTFNGGPWNWTATWLDSSQPTAALKTGDVTAIRLRRIDNSINAHTIVTK